MSRWQDDLILIEKVPQGKDADGFPLPERERRRLVFCNVISVGQGEFYRAMQAGAEVKAKCEVRTADYHGETVCELKGWRYSILRSFAPGSGEFTELTLTDIRQAGSADNG